MSVEALVIDASIAVKWLIEEDGTPLALALRADRAGSPHEHPLEEGSARRAFRPGKPLCDRVVPLAEAAG